MTEDNRLLDVVDSLTKPTIEHLTQKDDDGNYIATHTTEHPALLEQLRAAINPSSNTAAGSASLKSTRNLIDSTALFEYGKMTAAISSWCAIYHVAVSRDPVVDLRRWYVAFMVNPSDSGWHERELSRWAARIRNHIEPGRRFELVTPCPVCKSDTWVDDNGDTMRHPLLVVYRSPAEGQVVNPRVTCRNVDCGATWDDIGSIEELGEELTERHAENE